MEFVEVCPVCACEKELEEIRLLCQVWVILYKIPGGNSPMSSDLEGPVCITDFIATSLVQEVELETTAVPCKMLSRKFWCTCFIVIAQNLSTIAATGEGTFLLLLLHHHHCQSCPRIYVPILRRKEGMAPGVSLPHIRRDKFFRHFNMIALVTFSPVG